MILAAGLTPAWQQILSFRRFIPGEVNRAQQAVWCGSGKVLNVGCALHHLGVQSKTLCLVGGNSGEQICADFQSMNIPVRWVKSRIPTRVCTTILDETTKSTTELVENSNSIPLEELDLFLDAFVEESASAQVVVLSGSLPAGAPSDFYRLLLEKTSAKAVLDIRGLELDATLSMRPYVVKPNREELARTVGRDFASELDLVAAMSELRDRGAEWVVVSQGAGPLLAVGPDGLIQIEIPKIDVCNPIGCGDCLAAGIAAGIDRNLTMYESLKLGIRSAAENASVLLPARNLSRLP
ncbi:MAG: PfkB family carbohydrate kinase [Schlesneria sp.]